MTDTLFKKIFSEEGSRRSYYILFTVVFFALSFFCFCWFIPTGYMPYFYSFSSIVRLYLAGLSFCILCFGTGRRNRYGIMAGAIGYSFCGLTLLGVVQYPDCLVPMICFPLMILGMEKIIRKERKYLLIIAAAFLAAGASEFFITGMIISVVYALIRLGLMYVKRTGEALAAFAEIILSLAVGVCLAGIILLPALILPAREHDVSLARAIFRLYPRTYYSALPGAVISNGSSNYTYSLIMGYTPLVIPTVFLMFMKKKENTFLKVMTGVCLAAVLFPAVSVILRGRAEGRPECWSWAAALLGMYILVREWDDLVSVTEKQKKALLLLCAGYLGICFLCTFSRVVTAMAAFPVLFFALLITGEESAARVVWRERILLGIAAFSAVSCAFWIYAPGAGSLALYAKENIGTWDERNNKADALITVPDVTSYEVYLPKEKWDSMSPVQKQAAKLQAALVDKEPAGIAAADLELPDYEAAYDTELQGAEISQGPNSFITTAENAKAVLTLQQEIPDAQVYVEFIGLEFTPTLAYDLYLGSQAVDPQNLYNRTNWNMLSRDEQIVMRREKKYGSAARDVNISVESSAGNKKDLEYIHPDDIVIDARRDFVVDLGDTGEAVKTVALTFPRAGIYSFDSLKIYEIPKNETEEKTAKLKENTLQDVEAGTDTLTGSITLEKEKLLCLTIPYADGWEAIIDGRGTEIYRVNEHDQGIIVPEGEHAIEFRYHKPFRKAGAVLSLLALAGLVFLIAVDVRKKRELSMEDSDR